MLSLASGLSDSLCGRRGTLETRVTVYYTKHRNQRIQSQFLQTSAKTRAGQFIFRIVTYNPHAPRLGGSVTDATVGRRYGPRGRVSNYVAAALTNKVKASASVVK